MKLGMNRLITALIVFVIWTLITLLGPKVQLGAEEHSLNDLVSHGIGWWFVAAVVFLFAVVAFFGWWKQVGLRAAEPASSWLYIWFPILLIAIFLAAAVAMGLPAPSIMVFVLLNTLLVGISEELMTRGILLYGTLTQYGIWASIIIVSLIFGGIHILNGFNTGNFGDATIQAVAAGMSGILFIGLRLRTNSLLPPILVHWFWDFALFMISSSQVSNAGREMPAPEFSGSVKLFLPLLFATPSFLYGLWLLRKIGQRDKKEFIGEER